jgi:hypothetical protein
MSRIEEQQQRVELAKQRWEQMVKGPFVPNHVNVGTQGTPEDRIANALEYIAVQLGEINAKLHRLTG